MEFFRSLLRAIGFAPGKVDFIADLPMEVSHLILRKLDTESLLNAAQVSRKWQRVFKSDSFLRSRAVRHLKEERQRLLEARPHYRTQRGRAHPVEQPQQSFFQATVYMPMPEARARAGMARIFGNEGTARPRSRKVRYTKPTIHKSQPSCKGSIRI